MLDRSGGVLQHAGGQVLHNSVGAQGVPLSTGHPADSHAGRVSGTSNQLVNHLLLHHTSLINYNVHLRKERGTVCHGEC